MDGNRKVFKVQGFYYCMKSIMNKEFAYLVGNFVADGSLYSSGNSSRFEFVDGSPYENELKYCLQHMKNIKNILENFLNKKLPPIIKKGNKYIIKFRNLELEKVFRDKLGFSLGKKHLSVDIPKVYRNSLYEKDFWIGYLDGDGSIARKSRKISAESVSKKIIDSFANYLKKKEILFSKYESKRPENNSYVIIIRSVSFRDFAREISFNHPLKSKLVNGKLKDRDFHVHNEVLPNIDGELVDYTTFFDDSVYVENGKDLLIKYRCEKCPRQNVKFNHLFSFLLNKGLPKEQILKEVSEFRFKKSKGSMNSVKLPMYFNEDISKLSKYVRIRNGNITFSRRYISSFNDSPEEIIKLTEKIFDISPKFTCRNELLFCSGVLSDFFNNLIKKKSN